MSNLREDELAFLRQARCTDDEIQRAEDAIFTVLWAVNSNDTIGSEFPELVIRPHNLHRSNRFKNSTRARVDQVLRDLSEREVIYMTFEDTGGRPAELATLDGDFVPPTPGKRMRILKRLIGLFGKAPTAAGAHKCAHCGSAEFSPLRAGAIQ